MFTEPVDEMFVTPPTAILVAPAPHAATVPLVVVVEPDEPEVPVVVVVPDDVVPDPVDVAVPVVTPAVNPVVPEVVLVVAFVAVDAVVPVFVFATAPVATRYDEINAISAITI